MVIPGDMGRYSPAGVDAAKSARLLAALNVAFFDAAIACWDAKYHYMSWRPFQAKL